MNFGLFTPTFADSLNDDSPGFAPTYSSISWNKTQEFALKAEELGFDSIWVPDHLIIGKDDQILDSLSVLTALATTTKEIHLGTVVLCSVFRHPAILAKMISTIDIISSGRMIIGLGSGFHQREFNAFDFPPVDRARTREIIKILRMLWEEDPHFGPASFEGSFYTLTEAVSKPFPIQRPMPIYLAGNSEESLRIAKDLANGWMTSGSVESCSEQLVKLKSQLISIEQRQRLKNFVWFGRTYIQQTTKRSSLKSKGLGGTVSELLEQIISLKQIGFSELIFAFPDFPKTTMAETFVKEGLPSI